MDKFLEVLKPIEILFLVHSFPRDIILLDILSPLDVKNIIAALIAMKKRETMSSLHDSTCYNMLQKELN